jgi:DNA-binding transcriptional MerR regulator
MFTNGEGGLKVGELARRFDLHPATLRYYEQIGLLPAAKRTAAGYRLYGGDDAARLEFIQKAKRLGLELGEIREILAFRERGEAPCCYVRELVGHKIEEVDRRIEELEDMRRELRALQERTDDLAAPAADAGFCHIIEKPTKAG